MPVQTLDQVKQENCWNEMKATLAKYGYSLWPVMSTSMQGISFEINLVPAAKGVRNVAQPSGSGRPMVGA